MKDKFLLLSIKLQNLFNNEEGQDLIEYALVVALIAFGATAAMSTLGGQLATTYTKITSTLISAT